MTSTFSHTGESASTYALDMERVTRDLDAMLATGPRELMALDPDGNVNAQAFARGDSHGARQFVIQCDAAGASGIYIGVNPLREPRLGPKGRAEGTLIATREYILFDIDAHDDSATVEDAERAALRLRHDLEGMGWPAPAIAGATGGGAYLMYRLEGIDNTLEDAGLIRRVLTATRAGVDAYRDGVRVDVSVSDAARVRRLSGTINRKYDHEPRCELEVDDDAGAVTRYLLDQIAASAPARSVSPAGPRQAGTLELEPEVIARLAAAVRPFRGDGNRHTSWLAIAGYLAHNRVSIASAERVLDAVCVDDRNVADRYASLEDSYTRYIAGEPVAWRAMLEDAGEPGLIGALDTLRHELAAPVPRIIIGERIAPPEPVQEPAPRRPLTDTGNAERLAHRYGDSIRFHATDKCWMVWDRARWKRDVCGAVERMAKDTVRSIPNEASAAELEGKEYVEYLKWAASSESAGKRAAMLELARHEPGISIEADAFDRDGWALNVQNGTIDLRTGELRPHRREDAITKLSPVEYDPDATCPNFETFLDEIMCGRRELVDFLQRAIGYTLTGDTSERVLFILHGGGKNGKSTLLKTIGAILGDYAAAPSSELLLSRRDRGAEQELAQLPGVRFVATGETDDGRRLDEARVKSITGSEPIPARKLYGDPFTYAPEFKIWLATNHKPTVRGNDEAIWDRIRLIPFDYRVPEGRRRANLEQVFMTEAPGILRWMVDGCLAWQRDGLGMPDAIATANAEYRGENDTLGAFLDECCRIAPDARVNAGDLYSAYRQWCEASGERELTKQKFGRELTARGFTQQRTNTARQWSGLELVFGPEPGLKLSPDGAPGDAFGTNGTGARGDGDAFAPEKRHPVTLLEDETGQSVTREKAYNGGDSNPFYRDTSSLVTEGDAIIQNSPREEISRESFGKVTSQSVTVTKSVTRGRHAPDATTCGSIGCTVPVDREGQRCPNHSMIRPHTQTTGR